MRRDRFLPSSAIARRLVVFVVSLKMAVVLFAVLTLYHSRLQYEARAVVNSENLARLLAHDLASSFDKIDLTLMAIKEEAERQIAAGGPAKPSLNAFIMRQSARHPDVFMAGMADANGDLRYGTGLPDSGRLLSIAQRAYFGRLKNEPDAELIVSEPVIGQITDQWSIIFARRVNAPNGGFAGAVYVSVTLEHFRHLFGSLNMGPHGVVNLRDMNLVTVVRFPDLQPGTATGNTRVSQEWPLKLRENPESGTYFATGLDQLARALAYRKIGQYPFYILVGHYPEDFLDGWYKEIRNTFALMLVFTLALSVFVWLLIKAWGRREADSLRLADLSHRLVDIQESERRKLALELHDVASPNLAALQINLGILQAELPVDVKQHLQPRFAELKDILCNVTANLRDVCANLRPTMLDYSGLLQALDDYAKNFCRSTAIRVTVTGNATEERLPPDVESLLFRIAQEALTNAAKHAQAASIEITLNRAAERTQLVIQDDGIGFDPKTLGKAGVTGLGLVTMRERAEFAGGRFSMQSSPGKGTRIAVEI